MRVLVTGSTGFAGSHVVRYLLESTPWEIVTIDRRSTKSPRVRRVVHDLARPIDANVGHEIGVVDVIINLASTSDVPTFLSRPASETLNNVSITLNLLEWARDQALPLRSFIQVSTNEVYGPAETGQQHDEHAALRPSTPYSGSKAAQEVIAAAWRNTYEIPVVIVNTMHLFGPGQPAQRFIPTVARRVLAGEPVQLYGRCDDSGHWTSASRNWTYVRSLADVLHWIIDNDRRETRWNVAGPHLRCDIMVNLIANLLNRDTPKIDWIDDRTARPGYELRYALDTNALYRAGYSPEFDFTSSLIQTLKKLVEDGEK